MGNNACVVFDFACSTRIAWCVVRWKVESYTTSVSLQDIALFGEIPQAGLSPNFWRYARLGEL